MRTTRSSQRVRARSRTGFLGSKVGPRTYERGGQVPPLSSSRCTRLIMRAKGRVVGTASTYSPETGSTGRIPNGPRFWARRLSPSRRSPHSTVPQSSSEPSGSRKAKAGAARGARASISPTIRFASPLKSHCRSQARVQPLQGPIVRASAAISDGQSRTATRGTRQARQAGGRWFEPSSAHPSRTALRSGFFVSGGPDAMRPPLKARTFVPAATQRRTRQLASIPSLRAKRFRLSATKR
jgi:hypothetical protein